jgi:hypothetical protein
MIVTDGHRPAERNQVGATDARRGTAGAFLKSTLGELTASTQVFPPDIPRRQRSLDPAGRDASLDLAGCDASLDLAGRDARLDLADVTRALISRDVTRGLTSRDVTQALTSPDVTRGWAADPGTGARRGIESVSGGQDDDHGWDGNARGLGGEVGGGEPVEAQHLRADAVVGAQAGLAVGDRYGED